MAGPREGTRLRIVDFLQKKGYATVEELAGHLQLAQATVRRHLDILLRDEVVSYTQVRNSVGRPTHKYHLTETGKESLPKQYVKLLTMMFKTLAGKSSDQLSKAQDGSHLLRGLLEEMGREAVTDHKMFRPNGQSLEEKLAFLSQVLSRDHFAPETEIFDGGVRIRLNNCPFRAAAMANSAVCFFDQTLISGLLDMPVWKQECILDGANSCCYVAAVRVSPSLLPAVR